MIFHHHKQPFQNAINHQYRNEFLVKKQNGIVKYKAVFEDLCIPDGDKKEIELQVDSSFINDDFIILQIPQDLLYKYNLFERKEETEEGINTYPKELIMSIKVVIDPRKASMKKEILIENHITWQRCSTN